MDEHQTPDQKAPIAKKTLLLALFVFVLLLTSFFFFSNRSEIAQPSQPKDPQTPTTSESATYAKPASTKKGYPFSYRENSTVQTPVLAIYSLSDNKMHYFTDITLGGSGANLGRGISEPVPSPDLLYSVYIDNKTNNVWLTSNETFEKVAVTDNGKVSFISGWSPDSKRFIYYVSDHTITLETQGYGGYQEEKVTFDKNLQSGFFLFDIDSGQTTHLYPVDYMLGFIDNSRLLVQSTETDDRLIVFDVDTFEADFGYVKEIFGFGAGQYDFTSDGKKWTFTLSNNPTTDANIMYADFPQKTGIKVETGNWADIQNPHFSPDGTFIAYDKKSGEIQPGFPRTLITIYNTVDKSIKSYAEGSVKQWVTNNEIIISRYNIEKKLQEYFLLTLSTNQVTPFE